MYMNEYGSYWAQMSDDEQEQFLEMAQEFRNMGRRVLANAPGAQEAGWTQAELRGLYQDEVQRDLGRAEDGLWEDGADSDDDQLDGFSQHCRSGYERGWSSANCGRQWRSKPG